MKKLLLVGALGLGLVFILGLSAIVVWGGARALLHNRTEAVGVQRGPLCESGEHAAMAGQRKGRSRGGSAEHATQAGSSGQAHGSQSAEPGGCQSKCGSCDHSPQDASPGQTQQNESSERGYPNAGEAVADRLVIEGTVTVGTASGEDIIVQSADGAEVLVGTGPQYLQSQGFVLESGDAVRISGYWDDGEFKAAQITRLSDGASIVLRDAEGRPAWAGSGQRAQSEDDAGGNGSQGKGRNQK